MNALRVLHYLFKNEEFKQKNEEKPFIPSFEPFQKEGTKIFFAERAKMDSTSESDTKKHEVIINVVITLSAFVTAYPEQAINFQALVPDLVAIARDKLDVVRQNSAVLLAKLCKNEDNAKVMRDNHGTEVLVSLQGALNKN